MCFPACDFIWLVDFGNNSNSTPEKAAFQAREQLLLLSFFFFFYVGMRFQRSQSGGSDKVAVRWLHQKPSTCSNRLHKWCTKRDSNDLKDEAGQRKALCVVQLWDNADRKLKLRSLESLPTGDTVGCYRKDESPVWSVAEWWAITEETILLLRPQGVYPVQSERVLCQCLNRRVCTAMATLIILFSALQ